MTTTQAVQTTQNDEIDLIGLILSIWKKKWWVVLFVTIFATISFSYVSTVQKQWTSKAEVIAPRNYEITNILKDRLEYARITGGELGDISKDLYGSFMTELRSINSRVDFLKQSKLYSKLTEEAQSEGEKQAILRMIASKGINVKWPNKKDKKNDIDFPMVAFSTMTSEDAQETLADYLAYLNKQVFALAEKSFLVKLENQISGLEFSLKRTEERLPLSRDIAMETKTKHLERAIATAKAAGIKEYARTGEGQVALGGEGLFTREKTLPLDAVRQGDETVERSVEENGFLLMPGEEYLQAQISARFSQVEQWFLLGEKYLQAQLDNVEKIPLIFPVEYYHKKTQLLQLKELLANKRPYVTDQSFHYQSAPYLPLKPDKSKGALIMLIGTFLGGIIGVLVALFMAALDNRKARERQAKD